MAEIKTERSKKKQFGQFMTPIDMCVDIVGKISFDVNDRVLEPSFGCGNFIISIIDCFLPLYEGDIETKLEIILNNNIWGVEMDVDMYESCLQSIKDKYGFLPEKHNLFLSDYLMWDNNTTFTKVIGNPPFGGTISVENQDFLDRKYGNRNGSKIKKETYSFFMVKSIESLSEFGELIFITSDTFLTIKTMTGLRKFLFNSGFNIINKVNYFSEETNYPMTILTHKKSIKKDFIKMDEIEIMESNMNLTSNFSWYMEEKYSKYFVGPKLDSYITASSGMTIGNNELFLREINENGEIVENYSFEFFDDPITLENEISKARNNKLSNSKIEEIKKIESNGTTKRNIRILKLDEPKTIKIPNDDYCYYNKSSKEILYSKPKTVVYWKNDGEAVYTYKKNGNWYLHGVGGKPFFKKEGFTWQLISSSIKARYLPSGYILDSGAPVAILNNGIEKNELLFIIGWLLTNTCNNLLKSVINHTKNIQSKDIEKLPYPFWVDEDSKIKVIDLVKSNINLKKNTGNIDIKFNENLEYLFQYK